MNWLSQVIFSCDPAFKCALTILGLESSDVQAVSAGT